MKTNVAIFLALALPALSQERISLQQAVQLALEQNHSVASAQADQKAADARIAQARAGFLPRLNYSESWTRSDNPVFVFSSLLTQHQFGVQNFALGALNRPDYLNNFQSLLTVDQTVYNGGRTRRATHSAALSKEIASEATRLTSSQIIAAAVRAYYDVLLTAEQLKAAVQANRSAEADLRRAESVRSAGLSTDDDVLSNRVHLAAVEEQRIQRSADLDVAQAALNDVLGIPLDTPHDLTTPLARASVALDSVAEYEGIAVQSHPEAREAKIAMSLAKTAADDARAALLPEVVLHAGFEADRGRFYDRGGANWLGSVGLRWNLFNGFADKARIEETKSLVKRSEADERGTGSSIRLQVRRAYANLRAAEQRIEAAKAAVAEAEESLRITQNRYEAGIGNVTDLLRTESAALDTRTRYLAAVHDQRVAAVMLEFAAGTLKQNSEVLN
jgi:outer membrane protein